MQIFLKFLVLQIGICQSLIYEVPCTVQDGVAYRLGTAAALMAASSGVGVAPVLTISDQGAGQSISNTAGSLLQFLWPMIIGQNDHCVQDAVKHLSEKVSEMTYQKVNNLTVAEIQRWFEGHAETAKKIYDWLPIIEDEKDEEVKRAASQEFLKELHYLYYSASEARDEFVEGSTNHAESFLFIRELAFMQFAVTAEIISNPYTPDVVKRKFTEDYSKDIDYYFRTGHVAVEKIVKCLPNAEIGSARASLSSHLQPVFEFAYSFFRKNSSALYTRQVAYKPIKSGDYVAFRLESGKLAAFESIFGLPPRSNDQQPANGASTCPDCGWDLFDDRYSPVHNGLPRVHVDNRAFPACRDSVFQMTITSADDAHPYLAPVGTNVLTCDIVSISYRTSLRLGLIQHAGYSIFEDNTPQFVINSYNDTTNEMLRCGNIILNRDRIFLTPTAPWIGKVIEIDAIILKAN